MPGMGEEKEQKDTGSDTKVMFVLAHLGEVPHVWKRRWGWGGNCHGHCPQGEASSPGVSSETRVEDTQLSPSMPQSKFQVGCGACNVPASNAVTRLLLQECRLRPGQVLPDVCMWPVSPHHLGGRRSCDILKGFSWAAQNAYDIKHTTHTAERASILVLKSCQLYSFCFFKWLHFFFFFFMNSTLF